MRGLCFVVSCVTPVFSQKHKQNTMLVGRDRKLKDVTIVGTSVKRINRSAYNAVSVYMTKSRNTNMDVVHALDKVLGVSVRADGGVGSATTININGFTGKRVKLFIDGVPMDGSASSFGIDNIPADLAS